MSVLIIGGTGTLGQELTRQLLERGELSIRVLSRCELKQKEMSEKFRDKRLSFTLGDVRDLSTVRGAMRGIHTVFYVAALKHVDTLEFNPEEAVKTNVLGTMNVADAAQSEGVRYVAFSSTDKAVAPINAYGMSKALAEKILLNRNRNGKTSFSVFRWANVMGSRGSVIPLFAETLKSQGVAYITDPEMTRFWIRIEDAARFMIEHHWKANGVMIPPMKAASVLRVIDRIAAHCGLDEYQVKRIGIRPGEKLHETITEGISSDTAEKYSDEELDGLLESVLGMTCPS